MKKHEEIEKEIGSQLYRRLMYQYFRLNYWNYTTQITQVKTFRQNNQVIVEIESHRPGLLIGKGGRFMDGLQKFIEEETNENIKLRIKECKLWIGLYK